MICQQIINKHNFRTISRLCLLLLAVICITTAAIAGPQRAPATPEQQSITQPHLQTIEHKDYTLYPMATFRMEGLALAQKRYRFKSDSDLTSVDVAFGWGPMSDADNLDHIKISQSSRWYYYRYEDRRKLKFPAKHIPRYSANMHLIAADKSIQKKLNKIRKNDIVSLEGFLVRATKKDGYTWMSSMSRHDTGDNSCELVYVTHVNVR